MVRVRVSVRGRVRLRVRVRIRVRFRVRVGFRVRVVSAWQKLGTMPLSLGDTKRQRCL